MAQRQQLLKASLVRGTEQHRPHREQGQGHREIVEVGALQLPAQRALDRVQSLVSDSALLAAETAFGRCAGHCLGASQTPLWRVGVQDVLEIWQLLRGEERWEPSTLHIACEVWRWTRKQENDRNHTPAWTKQRRL